MPINSRTHCQACNRTTEAENVGPDVPSVPVYCVPGCVTVVERSAVAMGQVYVEQYYVPKRAKLCERSMQGDAPC